MTRQRARFLTGQVWQAYMCVMLLFVFLGVTTDRWATW